MKNLAPSFLLALLALTGCGAAAEGFDADANSDSELAGDADSIADTASDREDDAAADDTQPLGTTQQALISSGGLGAKPWCAARKNCYDQCGRDYPGGGGPLSTCKQLCDTTTASKCRPGLATGGELVIF
jgi:hypothetical protein